MNNLLEQFTVTYIICPDRQKEFFNAWSSSIDLTPSPIYNNLIFNPFSSKDHDFFLDDASCRTAQIIKLDRFHNLAQMWNWGIMFSPTRYCIISNEDIVWLDPEALQKVYEKHQEGYKLVHLTEAWSCFSIDKELIGQVGWFDERFVHSWEDVDYRYRMMRKDIKDYRFFPYLVKHLRSPSARQQDFWDKSSSYFFEKWNIENGDKRYLDPKERQKLQATGYFRELNPKTLNPNFETPNYYPYWKINE